jgi:trans-aconitate methyltransferase
LIDLLDPQPGERILDVGCGSGELTNCIVERGAIGIGFDFDPSMVKRAQEQFPKTTFFQADASNFQVLEGGPVDAIFSNAALHWVRDADGAAASMSKALKSGGRFVVA